MKTVRIISIIGLLLFLKVLVACQSSSVENLEEETAALPSIPTDTPNNTISPTQTPLSLVENLENELATSLPAPTTMPTIISPAETLSGNVYIVSEPEGAWVSIDSEDLSGETPMTWTMRPGTYTATLTLAGYQEWTAPITVTVGDTLSLTVILRETHTIIPITELNGPLWDVRWSNDGRSLSYGVNGGALPVYQDWWRYDVASGETQPLPPPQTRVTNAVRETLGICPYPLPETRPYPCLPTLWESPPSERIVFSSGMVEGEINTWLANIDGSDVLYLDMIPGYPGDVMWSSDDQWLLIGHYWGVDGSNLYYLVKSDGTFVANLEKLTGTSHFRVQGPKPRFSPDGQQLAFVGTEVTCKQPPCEALDREDAYNLYVLDLETLERQFVSSRFGLFQWAHDGRGLYVLDGSANTAGHSVEHTLSGVRVADFYYIDLSQETPTEEKLARDIPLYLPYLGAWAYSPEAQAMAGTFAMNGPVFGLISLKEFSLP